VAETGAGLRGEVSAAIEDIDRHVTRLLGSLTTVRASCADQNQAVETIAGLMGRVETAARDSRETSQASAGAAGELARDVASLEGLMTGMRLDTTSRAASSVATPAPLLLPHPSRVPL